MLQARVRVSSFGIGGAVSDSRAGDPLLRLRSPPPRGINSLLVVRRQDVSAVPLRSDVVVNRRDARSHLEMTRGARLRTASSTTPGRKSRSPTRPAQRPGIAESNARSTPTPITSSLTDSGRRKALPNAKAIKRWRIRARRRPNHARWYLLDRPSVAFRLRPKRVRG